MSFGPAQGQVATSIAPGATGGPLHLTKNGAGAPPYSFAGDTNTGVDSYAADQLDFVTGGTSRLQIDNDSIDTSLTFNGSSMNLTQNLLLASSSVIYWNTHDNYIASLAADSLRQGAPPSATPGAQTFTIGEASRPGTDTNVGGSSGTLRPGLGTGTGTAPKFAIQGVVLTGSGSGVQSYQDMIAVTGVALGFYNAAPVALQTGVAVTAVGIHAALVNLGLITA